MGSTNTIPMMVLRMNGKMQWPRRQCIDQYIPAELKLYEAIKAIDELPGDTTDMVIDLQSVRDRLADWVEAQGLVAPIT